ncbi:TnsA-like heteromeric transposase endonuclease subunit [Streptomyces sp. UNOB3_S3]|uniref:TnsA-like heteromeric transposase endonuclease subunit n=1 Tax=Streptomyces sp. UNOB3_S3 TaxID=2871682 RepID=UPI001E3D1B0A|nr:TnsA-like heteromeric transposase endonuclease subunit [Streptomyces sp. UNOB3_S3]MCC3773619.1 TnsA-like heteromeric transposase endonuclease subunit [Streptomyces sp. UNOB3_S3]
MNPPRTRTLRPIRLAMEREVLHYLDADGTERLIGTDKAADVMFEDALPARTIPSYAGQRHTPGRYWSATTDRMIEYESYLELQRMKLLDYDTDVTAFAAQPFMIEGRDAQGGWKHTPDLFARRRDGSALLVDVKPRAFVDRPAVLRQSRRTAEMCARIGWDYQLVSEPDSLMWATVSWLAGYRRPLHAGHGLADRLLLLACKPVPIGELISFQPAPELARPMVFHLMWHHQLNFDQSLPLRDHTRVWSADAPRNA